MSHKPVWALGRALAAAGVPCAEAIAMMLGKKREPVIADTPYATDTAEILGGSYVDAVYFNGDGANESTVSFSVGKFPMEQSFEWIYHWGWSTAYGTNQAPLKLQLVNMEWSHKVGDYIKLRYTLPTVTSCSFFQSEGLSTYSPKYYSFSMELVNDETASSCTVTHSGATGTVSCIDGAAPLFDGLTFTPTTNGNSLLGLELGGRLLRRVDAVNITITAHASSTYNNAALFVEYANRDCLTVEAYEVTE